MRATVPIIRQLPKPSRRPATSAFRSLLEEVVKDNSIQSWQRLLSFAPRCLFSLKRGGKRLSLASQVNKQIDDSSGPSESYVLSCHKQQRGQISSPVRLRAAVTQRLEGDFRGAIRIASSTTSLAEPTEATFKSSEGQASLFPHATCPIINQ